MGYDHVIVGAGSAGCVLANRLSANASRRVLLIEAGPRDWHPFIHMPAGLGKLARYHAINWDYRIEPEPGVADRRIWWPRGKVLGGSSSINAMCFVRGAPEDYDDWARATGDERWAWPNALAHFKRMESNSRGAGPWHGGDGPQGVSDLRHHNELSAALIEAAAAAGFPRNDDFNGADQEGFGYYQVSQKNGVRCSTASGYLAPVMARANLEVRTGALCRRIVIERGRATGVEVERRGRIERIEAGEVIVCGGSINSPQLLMLSGIGPADHLREHGIAIEADLPGVGENLSDHLDVSTLVGCTLPVTYDGINKLAVGLHYLFTRSGIGASDIAESGGFVRSRFAPDRRCDLQFHFVPAMLNDRGRSDRHGGGYNLHVCHLKPRSRGRIRLHSPDPAARAAIFAGYLGDPEGHDLAMLVEGVALSRQILAQAPFDPYRGEELLPGPDATGRDEVEAFIRHNARTIYHPVGTCRMGRDAHAVTDPQLRVRGIEGLRVVDASVMPELPSGNTNAPTIMIAEVAAGLILAGKN
ncbi:MAG: choline dehydrogenase [Proteobacteria bacterium]|nr:choline dehydrogenase [Pseudomonadota bacterium]